MNENQVVQIVFALLLAFANRLPDDMHQKVFSGLF